MSMLRVVVARALRPAVRGRMQASVRCYSTAHGDDALPPAEFDAKWKVSRKIVVQLLLRPLGVSSWSHRAIACVLSPGYPQLGIL